MTKKKNRELTTMTMYLQIGQKRWILRGNPSQSELSRFSTSLKGPFCNPDNIFLWHSSVDIDKNKLIPKFPVNFEVVFVSYARFYCTVSLQRLLCLLLLYRHKNIGLHNLTDYFSRICKKYLAHKHYVPKGFSWCKIFFFFWEKWGDEAVDHKMDL